MNSKQRVLNTIENKPAEQIPINFSANKWVREKLCQQHNFKNHLQLLNFFHSDVVDLRDCVSPLYVGPEIIPDASKDNISENYWGWQTKVIDTPRGKEEQFCGFKLQNVSSVNEPEEYRCPEVSWFDFSDFESGHKIGLNGGIDTQKFLPTASEKEIRAKIRETIDYFENKSGYILSTTHVIEGDITPENIFALFDESFNYQNLKATK